MTLNFQPLERAFKQRRIYVKPICSSSHRNSYQRYTAKSVARSRRFQKLCEQEKSIEGDLKVGGKLMAVIAPPDSNAMTFKPTVLVAKPNHEFRWLGHFIILGLFDGEHIFELIDNRDGTTTFIH
jgi:hypothetical protein